MTHLLRSWYFNNQEHVEASEKKFFASNNKNWYQRGIQELKKKQGLKTAQHDSNYFKYLAALVVNKTK